MKFSLLNLFFLTIFIQLLGCADENKSVVVSDLEFIYSEKKFDLLILNGRTISESNAIKISLLSNDLSPLSSHNLTYSKKNEGSKNVRVNFEILRDSLIVYRDIPIILHVYSQEINLDEKLFITLSDVPKMEELNWPQRNLFLTEENIQLLKNENAINFQWLNFKNWKLPKDPNWNENPFNNSSWRLFYHSLGWLTIYGELYLETQEYKYLEIIENYLRDYDTTFDSEELGGFAYREDAVSIRSNHLLYLYLKVFRNLDGVRNKNLISLIEKNTKKLLIYLNNDKYDDDNHGLIQARSAFNIAAALPRIKEGEELISSGISRVLKLSELMFAESGLSVEQSIEYHFIGVAMLLQTKLQLKQFNIELPFQLIDVLNRSLLISPYLLYQDGTAPGIGDSAYGQQWREHLKRYIDLNNNSDINLQLYITNGQSELLDLKVIEDEGFVIAKHHHETLLSKIFFDVSKKRHVHGHFDNLNIVAELNSQKVLIDSGGPYIYSSEGRENFWGLSAHNTLVINEIMENKFDAELISTVSNELHISASGNQQISTNITHQRSFTLLKSEQPILVVFDSLKDNENKKNKIEEYWHFPENTSFFNEENKTKLLLSNGSEFYHYYDKTVPTICDVITGQLSENNVPKLGWVTYSYNTSSPAPVKHCLSDTDNYASYNVFTNRSDLEIEANFTGNTIGLKFDGYMIEYDRTTNNVRFY